MKVYTETSIEDFSPWGDNALETKDAIIAADKVEEFDAFIEEEYPDGISETELNDMLAYEGDTLCNQLGFDLQTFLNEMDEDDEFFNQKDDD